MIIAVSSPRKAQGQTVTAINIAATYASKEKSVLLIDTNSTFSDMDYYLSGDVINHGIDDFITYYQNKYLDTKKFMQCTIETKAKFNVMMSNKVKHLSDEIIQALLQYASTIFDVVVIDTSNQVSSCIYKKADAIYLVVTPNYNVLASLESSIKNINNSKIRVIVNKFYSSKITLTKKKIKGLAKKIDIMFQ